MKKLYSTVLLFIMQGFTASVWAYSVTCPPSVAVEKQQLNVVPEKWQVFQSQPPMHMLSGLTFYSGHPQDQASLAPDRGQKSRAQWKFTAGDKIFIACSYQKTAIELIQELPAVKRCDVIYDENQQGWVPKQVECKE